MLLFLISFLMVMTSSYFLASIFESKKYLTGAIYTLLIAFAQVVFTIEFLSLFKAISPSGILIINALLLITSILFWNTKNKPLYKPQLKEFALNSLKAFKKDKILAVIFLGFVVFVFVSVFLCTISPIMSYDALSYHLNRAVVWAFQGSLSHFDIGDDRNIYMAINSEILYTWLLTFFPKNAFIGFFSFAGYILAACSLYSFLEICGFCMRKRLWSLFLFSSLSGVITEASGSETNLIIGALTLTCLNLFFLGVKKDKLTPIYFSSLAISLALGTKSSAFFTIPALAIIFTYLLLKYQKGKFWYYCAYFFGFSALNILAFSAYNYIQNFIAFGNPMGPEGAINHHKMKGGLKGFISGSIRHMLMLLDFTGFRYGLYIEKYIFEFQDKLLNFLNIPLDLNVKFSNHNQLNLSLNESYSGCGVIGTFVLLPCAILSIFKGVFCRKSSINILFALIGSSLFINIFVLSALMGYMVYSSRFILTFGILAAPLLIISYIKSNKNIIKYIILFWVMSNLVLVSTHIWQRHFVRISKELISGNSISEVRTKNICSLNFYYTGRMEFCDLRYFISKLPVGTKIGIFPSLNDNIAIIKLMEADGYKIDLLALEKTHKYDLKAYDYIIFTTINPNSSYVTAPDETIKNYYVENKTIKFVDPNKAQCVLLNDEDDGKQRLITEKNYKKIVISRDKCNIPYQILHNNGFETIAQIIYRKYDNWTGNPTSTDKFLIFKRRWFS